MSPSIIIQPGFADVVERFDSSLRQRLSRQGHQVLNQIQACRTSLLGGRLLQCGQCHKLHFPAHREHSFRSIVNTYSGSS